MALYLRGNVWWFEYRTSKVRVMKSTGFRKPDKAKAQAAYDAFRLGMGAKPVKSAMEKILEAIYGGAPAATGIALSSVWHVYDEWCRGKGRSVARATYVNRQNLCARLVEWCQARGATDISDVTVAMAREYVASIGRANKTLRTYCGYLSQIWDAVGQLHPGVHNPWKAVTPDNDGSSVRHEAFDDGQIKAVLDECRHVGHDWRLASLIALYTGLRYGDIATLDWNSVDLDRRLIVVTPSKTRKSSKVKVWIPIAEPLWRELSLRRRETGFVLPEHGLKYTAGRGRQPVEPPFSSVLAAVGLAGREYGFHSWRHTANSRMADAGIPSEVRQMLCGWTNADMARHYDHARHISELSAAVSAIAGEKQPNLSDGRA